MIITHKVDWRKKERGETVTIPSFVFWMELSITTTGLNWVALKTKSCPPKTGIDFHLKQKTVHPHFRVRLNSTRRGGLGGKVILRVKFFIIPSIWMQQNRWDKLLGNRHYFTFSDHSTAWISIQITEVKSTLHRKTETSPLLFVYLKLLSSHCSSLCLLVEFYLNNGVFG